MRERVRGRQPALHQHRVAEHFVKDKRQNRLERTHIDRIVATYRDRTEAERYSRRVSLQEIAAKHEYNLNISRYVSTAQEEEEIDLGAVHEQLVTLEREIVAATKRHNAFLIELGLPPLPIGDSTS